VFVVVLCKKVYGRDAEERKDSEGTRGKGKDFKLVLVVKAITSKHSHGRLRSAPSMIHNAWVSAHYELTLEKTRRNGRAFHCF